MSSSVSLLRAMLMTAGIAHFDRYITAPMVIPLARELGVSVTDCAAILTAHFVAYGATQVGWGLLSDRYGRFKIARIALLGTAIGSVLSAVAPTLPLLTAARALTGACCGALVPATITFVGDSIELGRRQHVMADMLACMAIGGAAASGMAGFVAGCGEPRAMFLLTGLMMVGVVALVGGSQAEPRAAAPISPLSSIAAVLSSRWACLIMVFAFIEGGLVLGLYALLPTILEQHGLSTSLAGAVAALYGMSVLVLTRLVKHITHRPTLPILLGGGALVLENLLPALKLGVPSLALTAILMGATWAFFHSTLQTWMTALVPSARATSVALMTTALFLGSGLGSDLAAPFVDAKVPDRLFGFAAAIALLLVVTSVILRSRWSGIETRKSAA